MTKHLLHIHLFDKTLSGAKYKRESCDMMEFWEDLATQFYILISKIFSLL